MQALTGSALLALWERGSAFHPLDRCALLAAAARPDWPADTVVDQPLGAINESLLRWREACFGPHIDAHVDCPNCGQRLSFELDTRALREGPSGAHTPPSQIEVGGLCLRPPSLRDLATAAGADDTAQAARTLLQHCTLSNRDGVALDDGLIARASDALEALDAQADLSLALTCPDCGHAGTAQLDPGALLWEELEASAQALLVDVHRLASAYGWTEDQVLALGPARRARYLALVGSS